jgi:hypothetical protein
LHQGWLSSSGRPGGSLRWRAPQQIDDRAVQAQGQGCEIGQRNVDVSLFDVADVSLAEAGSGTQAPLREAARGAQSNEIVGDPIANLSAGLSVQVELSLVPT